jgi:hypothetical protein
MNVEAKHFVAIAKMAHEANKAYCESEGDYSQKPWVEAPAHNRISAIAGVKAYFDKPNRTPAESHQAWVDNKLQQGWRYGAIKSDQLKTHPSLLPYDQLPLVAKYKDSLFRSVVLSYIDYMKSQTA